MQTNSEVSVLTGNLEAVSTARPLMPFSDEVISFLDDLSKILITKKEFPDVVTFGFWIRRANLLKEKEAYEDIAERLGRGVAFHIAPSNVPLNFAFTLAMGLLAGNANIVRLPGKEFLQVEIIAAAINTLTANSHKNMLPYVCFVKYPAESGGTAKLSHMCDVRVIWGGDKTISDIRRATLPPRATEITFADRYSIALINSEEYLQADNKPLIAQKFYNDTYLSDQNACSSPFVVFWTGDNKDEASNIFWENLRETAQAKYPLSAVQAVGKLSAKYMTAALIECIPCENSDNYVTMIQVNEVAAELPKLRYHSGFFYQCYINEFADMLPICGNKLQTLVYYGISAEEIRQFVLESGVRGIDRIVPIGKSMDFALVWDGHDMIREMSRRIVL